MKIIHLKNGDMIISQGAKPLVVILGMIIFLLVAKDAFIWIFTAEKVQGSRFFSMIVIVITLLIFYRIFSLKSNFKFSCSEKNLKYSVQYPFFNKKGVVPIAFIKQAILETNDEGAARVIIECNQAKIPMTCSVESLGGNNAVVIKINEWLKANKNSIQNDLKPS